MVDNRGQGGVGRQRVGITVSGVPFYQRICYGQATQQKVEATGMEGFVSSKYYWVSNGTRTRASTRIGGGARGRSLARDGGNGRIVLIRWLLLLLLL